MFNIIKKSQPAGLYFAYGANMSKRSMLARCPHAKPVKAFYLLDWRLMFSHHATIVPAAGTAVAGCLWRSQKNVSAVLIILKAIPITTTKFG